MSLEIFLQNGTRRSRSILILSCALGLALFLAPQAQAAFIGDYALSGFKLINTNADGSFLTPDAGASLVLTGGNTGSGKPGTTDLLTTSTGSGLVSFQYSYSAFDFPGFDYAGYLVGGNFFQLADTTGQSGMASFPVLAGNSFGFRVGTVDNTGEPGNLTISNFSAPAGTGPAVPEPATAGLVCIAGAAMLAVRSLGRRS